MRSSVLPISVCFPQTLVTSKVASKCWGAGDDASVFLKDFSILLLLFFGNTAFTKGKNALLGIYITNMDYNGMAECSYLKFFWRPICLQINNTKTSDFIQGKKRGCAGYLCT